MFVLCLLPGRWLRLPAAPASWTATVSFRCDRGTCIKNLRTILDAVQAHQQRIEHLTQGLLHHSPYRLPHFKFGG